jgi:methyl-accepting chemotaxis protein
MEMIAKARIGSRVFLDAARRRLPARHWLPQTIKGKILGLIAALLAVQAALLISMLVGMISTHRGAATLVEQRMEPINEVQSAVDAYVDALSTAQKIRTGNLSPESGIAKIEAARQDVPRQWRRFRARTAAADHPALVSSVDTALADAEETSRKLVMLLRSGSLESLDFFVGGQLYGAIDPLTDAGQRLTDALRADAARERAALDRTYRANLIFAGLLTLLAIMIGAFGALVAIWRISRPLAEIAAATRGVETGDEASIPSLDRDDEIGDIARGLRFARERATEAQRLREEAQFIERARQQQELDEHRADAERAARLDRVFQDFDSHVSQVMTVLADATARMRASSAAMARQAGGTERDALASATLASQTALSVQQISMNGAALAQAIEAIRLGANDQRLTVMTVRDQAEATRAQAENLDTVASEISEVIELIVTIARRTNLLALNATIEASRAGEFGRGFAVVAAEVKQLARQTQSAAGRISDRLGSVRASTRDVSESIRSIDMLMGGVDQSAAQIAAAVEEQGHVSRDIAAAITQVATGSDDAARSLSSVKRRATDAHEESGALSAIADDIAAQTKQLQGEIAALLDRVRAG